MLVVDQWGSVVGVGVGRNRLSELVSLLVQIACSNRLLDKSLLRNAFVSFSEYNIADVPLVLVWRQKACFVEGEEKLLRKKN